VADVVVAAAELDVPPHAASPTPSAGTHSATATPRLRLLGRRLRRLARTGSCWDAARDSSWRPVSLRLFISCAPIG
jgi:hypothetical protein